MSVVRLHTDGSCLGNPGPGGWAAILQFGETERELYGGFRLTTNNRMEVLAAIEGLECLKRACEVELFTDSRYLADAIEKGWLAGWQKKGWKTAAKKPVKNADLWRRLIPLLEAHSVRFYWLRGHAGHKENERCDQLAKAAAQKGNLPVDQGYESQQDF